MKKKNKSRTPKNEHCQKCPGACCKNLALEIGAPVNKQEIEDLKWQLHFDTVKVYIRGKRWYQWIKGKCIFLSDDNRCTSYNERPSICRKHNPPHCEFFGKFYNIMFSAPQDLEKYLNKKKRKK